MDEQQAQGFMLRPTGMLPEVFPRMTPADPTYGHLAALPAAGMAQLMGGNGSTQRVTNNLGKLYDRAGSSGWLPSTNRMLKNFTGGKGIDQLFSGVKAGPGDVASYQVPGYTYGQEPLMLGEATQTASTLLDAALFGEPLAVQQKYGSLGWGGYLLDKWAARAARRPVGRGPTANRYVGRRLFR